MGKLRDKQRDLLAFKNAARGSRSPIKSINSARKRLPVETYPEAARWLETAAPKGRHVTGPSFPSSLQEIHRFWRLDPLELEEEFIWAASRILLHTERINKFTEAGREISMLVMQSDYLSALDRLNDIERAVGSSLWGLKLRLALLQRAEGFDGQKRFALQVRGLNPDGLVNYVAHYVSIRNETALSPGSFRSLFERHRSDDDIPPDLAAYTAFHVLPGLVSERQRARDILSWEGAGSVIDLFETAVRLSGYLFNSSPLDFQSAAGPVIHLLAKQINDPRLYGLDAVYTGSWPVGRFAKLDLAPFDAFLEGRYGDAIDYAERAIGSTELCWEYLDVIGRAAAAGGKSLPSRPSTFAWDISSWMYLHLAQDAKGAQANEHMLRIAYNWEGLQWADRAYGFLATEVASSGIGVEHVAPGAVMPPLSLLPTYAWSLDPPAALKYLEACEQVYGNALSVTYTRALLLGTALPAQLRFLFSY